MATTVKTQESGIGMVHESTLEKINQGIAQASLGLVIMMGGLIGLWSVAVLISAAAQSGGLVGLASNWLTAITGM